MSVFLSRVAASLPLFVLIFLGYGLVRWGRWPSSVSDALTRFVFGLALPAMLFFTLSDFSSLPPVDVRLLIAFFGGALLVFGGARLIGRAVFKLDGVAGSILALGCIFSNNLMLGLPMAKATLGDAAMPSVALVLAFNALILWSLVTISIEWARHGELSARGILRTVRGLLRNPLLIGIVSGFLFGITGWPLPAMLADPLAMLGHAAAPLALIVLGMGLAEYRVREGIAQSLVVCTCKLLVLPLVVWLIAHLIGLPPLETQVVVLLSSMAIGVNVYMMSRHFGVQEGATAASLVLSTVISSLSSPVVMTLLGPG